MMMESRWASLLLVCSWEIRLDDKLACHSVRKLVTCSAKKTWAMMMESWWAPL